MKKYFYLTLLLAILAGSGYICIKYYGYVFAKTVRGQILRVERVNQAEAIIAGGAAVPASQLYSYAVAIRDDKGEIHTSSSEDRQWAVAQSGQYVEAKFYPYPPWQFDKDGTYHGARLVRLYDCPK